MNPIRFKLLTVAAACVATLGMVPAHAVQTVYTTTLKGGNEAPPNVSAGIGLAIVTLDDSSFTMRVQTVFFGLTGTVTASHIHCCTLVPDTGTAGVATMTPTFLGFPSGVTQGAYDATFDMSLAPSWNASFVASHGGTTASAFSALHAGLDSGSAYLNIHSTAYGGGEIRGFLAGPVPEPQTYALMLAGLGMLGWTAKRRQRG
jgi:hypothetical protein